MSLNRARTRLNGFVLTLAVVVDALLLVLGALILWIAVTGGGVMILGGYRISLTGVDNPLLGLTLLGLIRYAWLRGIPGFGAPRWTLTGLDGRARAAISRLQARIAALTERQGARLVGQIIVAATVTKTLFAWTNPGFFSGDDVEIHEMSLRTLWHTDWAIWDLRSAFFPLGVVYPFQKLFVLNGAATSTATLVFSGRLAVALWSSVAIWLVWRVGRRVWPDAPGWAALAALLFATAKLHVAFGSSELPRPVATVFVLGAFALLQDLRPGRVLLAAVLLGTAACFRFSEVVFLGPALVMLVWERRWTSALAVVAIAVATALAIVGLTDWWYWGEAFHSVRAAIDYALIQNLSSRGYQSVAWYVLHAPEWINPAVAVLAVLGMIVTPRSMDLWAWLPLVVLSVLPHKEARYAIPVLPFLCLTATRGLQAAVNRIQETATARPGWRPVALLSLLAVGLIQDIGHWRLPRTNTDVQFARLANGMIPVHAVVSAEQAWRLGGHLYLRPHDLVDLDPGRLDDPTYLWQRTPSGAWIILDRRTTDRAGVTEALRAHGYGKLPVVVSGSRYELWSPARP
jgi:hypothetical protein